MKNINDLKVYEIRFSYLVKEFLTVLSQENKIHYSKA